ncbi:hypothetical protein CALCODRAFT_514922 [Calocera cornea HHB12733]|uniref:Uncharacterized protein n=1 Tax=Calocera cornea HHB12733 TaxID=1353952 RepID=A0A165IZN2_9BASI|nr:hypothetical protein CALCODRAFT_514922 [Calocera cornea HHB12733]
MAPRTRRQATQTTDSSDSPPQRPRRTTRTTSSSAPKAAAARAPRGRATRAKRNEVQDEQESPQGTVSSTEQPVFEPLAVSSPRTPNNNLDTSEDRVEDILNAGANESLASVSVSQDILEPPSMPLDVTPSPKNDLPTHLPPSSPPSRLPSSSTDSGEANANTQALLPPSKRLGRPLRRPGMIRPRPQTTAQPEPPRDASLSPSSDPFGFFALEKRLRPSKSEAIHRMEEQIQHEAEIMADEPSVQFSDGVPFASPMRRRMQEEQSMAEVDAALADVTNAFEPVEEEEAEELEEVEQVEAPKRARKPRSKAATTGGADDLVARLPKRKPRSAARTKKNDQENTSRDPMPRKTARKVSKAAPKGTKADLRKRQKTDQVDEESEPEEGVLQAREQRMKLYKDLESYNLEEELVI